MRNCRLTLVVLLACIALIGFIIADSTPNETNATTDETNDDFLLRATADSNEEADVDSGEADGDGDSDVESDGDVDSVVLPVPPLVSSKNPVIELKESVQKRLELERGGREKAAAKKSDTIAPTAQTLPSSHTPAATVTLTPRDDTNTLVSEAGAAVSAASATSSTAAAVVQADSESLHIASCPRGADPPTLSAGFNFASHDAGAKIISTSAAVSKASAMLTNDDDRYMMAPCETNDKSFVIQLSEDILLRDIEIANFEHYSSSVQTFSLYGSSLHPTDQWTFIGTFHAPDTHDRLFFAIGTKDFAVRYIKFVWNTQWRNEYYCTLTHVRVYGISVLEAFRTDLETLNEELGDFERTIKEIETHKITASAETQAHTDSPTADAVSSNVTESAVHPDSDERTSNELHFADETAEKSSEVRPPPTPLTDALPHDQNHYEPSLAAPTDDAQTRAAGDNNDALRSLLDESSLDQAAVDVHLENDRVMTIAAITNDSSNVSSAHDNSAGVVTPLNSSPSSSAQSHSHSQSIFKTLTNRLKELETNQASTIAVISDLSQRVSAVNVSAIKSVVDDLLRNVTRFQNKLSKYNERESERAKAFELMRREWELQREVSGREQTVRQVEFSAVRERVETMLHVQIAVFVVMILAFLFWPNKTIILHSTNNASAAATNGAASKTFVSDVEEDASCLRRFLCCRCCRRTELSERSIVASTNGVERAHTHTSSKPLYLRRLEHARSKSAASTSSASRYANAHLYSSRVRSDMAMPTRLLRRSDDDNNSDIISVGPSDSDAPSDERIVRRRRRRRSSPARSNPPFIINQNTLDVEQVNRRPASATANHAQDEISMDPRMLMRITPLSRVSSAK